MLSQESIEKVVLAQKEMFTIKEKIIDRELMQRIKLQNKFAIIISGIRRSGKSTLMKSIAKKIDKSYYINFEDPRLVGFELSDFERLEIAFKNVYGESRYYFYDEIQIIEKWEFHIRKLLDQQKYVVITGSNASLLSRELGTKLTGRNLRYEIFPFSYNEYLKFTNKQSGLASFKDYLKIGGFPEYILLSDKRVLNDLLSDILQRDIAVRHKIRNTRQLNELSVFLITNVTKEFSYNNLRKMFDLGSTNTVSQYISFLEDSYLLFTLSKFDYSLKKQAVNPKKIYVMDNGLIIQNSKSYTVDLGKLLENMVFINLKSNQKDVFYYKGVSECDFVIREGSKIDAAYQVCYKLDDLNKKREIDGLLEAMRKFNLKKGTILTYDQQDEFIIENKKIFIIPLWKWLTKEVLA